MVNKPEYFLEANSMTLIVHNINNMLDHIHKQIRLLNKYEDSLEERIEELENRVAKIIVDGSEMVSSDKIVHPHLKGNDEEIAEKPSRKRGRPKKQKLKLVYNPDTDPILDGIE